MMRRQRYFVFLLSLLTWKWQNADALLTVPMTPHLHNVNNLQIHSLQRIKTRQSAILSLDSLSFPLVPANDEWGNWAALCSTAAFSQVVGTKTSVGRLLGAPVTAMALSFVMASIGILQPGGTPAARALQLLSLQMATPLILLGADLRDAIQRCGPLFLSFMVASVATLAASFVGWNVSRSMLTAALGRDGLVIAAALLAKNIGGGINYVAVCRTLNANPTAVAAGLCVDNIFALIYFPVTSILANGKPDIETITDKDSSQADLAAASADAPVTVQSISNTLCLSALLLWLGERIGGPSGALPVCTLLTVAFASWAPREKVMQPIQPTANCLGLACLYLFFATAGAPGLAVAESVKASILPLALFLSMLYAIHGAILLAGYSMFQRSSSAFVPQRLLVASSAAIGGPATAVALAEAAGWKSLAVPSILVGNIGYAIATFCALAFHSLLNR
ncbi:hypothetical protein FisN_5Lh078 [Fistulifera solaris]|uniref:DUF819 domain-containing protein n=1 Tax=Fistulifera solaris TaxID=1519565 RepID=A0A1Z5JJ94_FISSO|nr:hypothetical protein FisN_5Lh078 [Fistulifera solaris]|eukprot:GAX14006.1 hypothetical protein FisN_5Lh078 [Fistulifera solaris]